jgi:hypothetical protein
MQKSPSIRCRDGAVAYSVALGREEASRTGQACDEDAEATVMTGEAGGGIASGGGGTFGCGGPP